MSRHAFLAAVVILGAASSVSAQGPLRSFLFGRNCPPGGCPSPGVAAPAPVLPAPAVTPMPMVKDAKAPAPKPGPEWAAAPFGGVVGDWYVVTTRAGHEGLWVHKFAGSGIGPSVTVSPASEPGGNLYDGSWPASGVGTGWFGMGVIGPGTGRGLFGGRRR